MWMFEANGDEDEGLERNATSYAVWSFLAAVYVIFSLVTVYFFYAVSRLFVSKLFTFVTAEELMSRFHPTVQSVLLSFVSIEWFHSFAVIAFSFAVALILALPFKRGVNFTLTDLGRELTGQGPFWKREK